MGWEKNAIVALIEEYRKYTHLYDTKSPFYKNKVKRMFALKNIAEEVSKVRPDTSLDDVKNKFNTLRTQYGRERRRCEGSQRSGCGMDEVLTPSLWFYSELDWLKPHTSVRDSTSSCGGPERENETTGTAYEDFQEMSDPLELMVEVMDHSNTPSPGNSSSSPAISLGNSRGKRKKAGADADDLIKTATGTLSALAERSAKRVETGKFAQYIGEELEKIKSKRRLLLLKQKIQDLVTTALLEEIDDEETM